MEKTLLFLRPITVYFNGPGGLYEETVLGVSEKTGVLVANYFSGTDGHSTIAYKRITPRDVIDPDDAGKIDVAFNRDAVLRFISVLNTEDFDLLHALFAS